MLISFLFFVCNLVSRMNSSFAFVANLRHLAKKAEKEAVPKARLEFLDGTKDAMTIDGVTVTTAQLAIIYKSFIKELVKSMQGLTLNANCPVNLDALAKKERVSNSEMGWTPLPNLSPPVLNAMFDRKGHGKCQLHTPCFNKVSCLIRHHSFC